MLVGKCFLTTLASTHLRNVPNAAQHCGETSGRAEQIVGRERRERVSQLAWCGKGCFDSRRRVNSTVRLLASMAKEREV